MNKSKLAIVIALIAVSMVTLVGSSYALFTKSLEGTKKVSIQTGTLKVDFSEGDSIKLENSAPMSDSAGTNTTPYTFTIENTGNVNAFYTIRNEEDSASTLDTVYLKYRLVGDNGYDSGIRVLSAAGTDGYLATTSTLDTGKIVTYKLYMWISQDATNDIQDKIYQSKIVVQSVSNLVSHYAFGNPTEADKINYLDVINANGYKVLNRLYGTEKAVCIYKDDTLECFKENNYQEEASHLKSVFGESNCTTTESGTSCTVTTNNDTFYCNADSSSLYCVYNSEAAVCKIDSSGTASCSTSVK